MASAVENNSENIRNILGKIQGNVSYIREMLNNSTGYTRKINTQRRKNQRLLMLDSTLKPIREQSGATKEWNKYVNAVYAELRSADPTIKRSQAMVIAKERRNAGDPAAPKRNAIAAPAIVNVLSGIDALSSNLMSMKAAKSAAKTRHIPGAKPINEEETLSVFKHKGQTYLRSSKNEVWLQGPGGAMGAWQGIYDSSANTIVPAPEPTFEGGRRTKRRSTRRQKKN